MVGEKVLDLLQFAAVSGYTRFTSLGLDPVALQLGPIIIRWYSLAYLAGIFSGYWLVKRMLRQPGAPMAARHVDDLLFYAMIGVIFGGRIGYILFYNLNAYLADPLSMLRLWDGGMSFHGGVIGVTLAIWWIARRNRLSFLRMCDYVACIVPIGMLFGRLANFVNGELWGRATDVPWAIIFDQVHGGGGPLPRHPSQLYEAGLEGLLMLIILSYMFWRTHARYFPGRLVGVFTAGIGLCRFIVEFFREPDAQLSDFARQTHLSMGQWLTIPLILLGIWLIATSARRRQRVEAVAGTDSVA